MTTPLDLDLTMYQGATFKQHLVWGCGDAIEITAVSSASPAVVTTKKAHGLPTSQLIVLTDIKGPTVLNDSTQTITVIDSTSFSLDGVDTTSEAPYLSGGFAAVPNDLTGYTALMHIRTKPTSDTLILELSTSNGRILLGGTNGVIEFLVAAADTSNIKKAAQYFYDLELTSSGGEVTRLLQGKLEVVAETTK